MYILFIRYFLIIKLIDATIHFKKSIMSFQINQNHLYSNTFWINNIVHWFYLKTTCLFRYSWNRRIGNPIDFPINNTTLGGNSKQNQFGYLKICFCRFVYRILLFFIYDIYFINCIFTLFQAYNGKNENILVNSWVLIC